MKLTIDTQVDTHEDIKKVLFILTNILEKNNNLNSNSGGLGSSFGNSNQTADTAALMSMFGEDSSSANEAPAKDPNAPPELTSFFNAISEKEQKKNEPKIEFF